MDKIAVIGLGLVGGSLALALKKSGVVGSHVTGYSRRPETVDKARERGVIDSGAETLNAAVREADLVIIATHVVAIKEVLKEISSEIKPDCVVTDAGSTKTRVMEWAEEYLPHGISFIGGHPMAGKETSGIDEADADLFHDCVYCLTPAKTATVESIQSIEGLVKAIGAIPLFIAAKEHDELVAGISHLPMMLSAAFVSATAESPYWPEMSKIAARGYRDLSRLASGNPEMNRDICITNREQIVRWIDLYINELKKYRLLVNDDGVGLKDALELARDAREKWLTGDSK